MSKCSPCRGPNRFSPAASRVLYELACCAIATMTLRKAASQLEPRIRLSLFVTRAPTASDLRMRARRPNRRRFPSASDLGAVSRRNQGSNFGPIRRRTDYRQGLRAGQKRSQECTKCAPTGRGAGAPARHPAPTARWTACSRQAA